MTAARRRYAAAFVVTIVVGVASRIFVTGLLVFDKYLGDALYAVAIYLVLAMAFPERRPAERAALTTVAVLAVESFQLTGWPADWRADGSPVLRFISVVLGAKFGWWDIVAYLVGIGAITGIDRSRLHQDSRSESNR